MPFYVSQGNIPSKRHIQHRVASGELCHEEHISREGFSDVYSNVYHLHPPTRVARVGDFRAMRVEAAEDKVHRHRHLGLYG